MALKQEFLFRKFARDYYFIQFNFFLFFCPNNVLISWKTLLCAYDFLENIVMCLSFPGKHCYVPVISWKTLLCAYDFLENIGMCLWFHGKHCYVPVISWKTLCAYDMILVTQPQFFSPKKKIKAKLPKGVFGFFDQVFGYPKANIGLLTWGEPPAPDNHHYVISILTCRPLETL